MQGSDRRLRHPGPRRRPPSPPRSSACASPRASPGDGRRGRQRLPGGLPRLPHLCRAGGGAEGGRRRPPVDRPALLDRHELPGPAAVGGQDQRQRDTRRGRARGPVRRAPPQRRAHGPRDDPAHPPLARRRLRHGRPDHEHRQHARGLDRVRGQPRRRRVRHLRRPVPLLAQEPPAERATGRSAPTSTGTTAIAGGCGGRTSNNPLAITYRGPAPFSAPETRAMRDFLAQPGRRRAPADPRRDLVPRGRPARDVAVRLHPGGRAGAT